MKIGIVGHEAAKFTPETEAKARAIIRALLTPEDAILVSGHCPLGGIDIWAEEVAKELGRSMEIFPPANYSWSAGYKPRNIKIARTSDIVHCLVVAELPSTYTGMRFDYCYHCIKTPEGERPPNHVKSGGCWTALRCPRHQWHVI